MPEQNGMEQKNTDLFWLRETLKLARKAAGFTRPNPLVGAVIVKENRLLAEGFHQKAGTPHAEIHALRAAGEAAIGGTLYVNLEPCCHYGKTPPCTEAIISAGIRRVVCCMQDPNPQVAGRGFARLREAGIEVAWGYLAQEAKNLNDRFIVNMREGRPFVALKAAMTLDGKTAARDFSSQWITGPIAREKGHFLRHEYGLVTTGIGTVLADDPQMNVRVPGLLQPTRLVLDKDLKIGLEAKILNTADAPTIIVTAGKDEAKKQALAERGVEIIAMPVNENGFDLPALLQLLYAKGFTALLLEAGAGLNGAFLRQNLVDKCYLFYAPKLVGGSGAPGLWGGLGKPNMACAAVLQQPELTHIGEDILVTGYLKEV